MPVTTVVRRLGARIERVFLAVTPDPFVLAIFLTAATGLLAWVATPSTFEEVIDAWQGQKAFWGLLSFSMQMCLVLVTGHALASAKVVTRIIDRLVDIPRTPAAAGAMVAFVSIAISFLNWGLALIAGALLARAMGKAAQRRGLRVHYPLLVAAGYTGLMTWHGGFSGSAPLKVTTKKDLLEMLPAEVAQGLDPVSIFETLLSPLNLVVCGGLLIGVPLLVALLSPGPADSVRGYSDFHVEAPPVEAEPPARSWPQKLERSPFVMALLVLPLLAALVMYFSRHGIARLDPNAVNLTLLTLGLVAHGRPRAYAEAVSEAVKGCSGIILQFPLYGGIMGIMAGTGLAKAFAGLVAANSGEGFLVMTFLSAGVLNFFVPSGGGQWAVQGPIAVQAAAELGVPLRSAVMAVAYGDQWSNMLQPFWALPLLGITGVKAGDILGYTGAIMLISGVWFLTALVVLG